MEQITIPGMGTQNIDSLVDKMLAPKIKQKEIQESNVNTLDIKKKAWNWLLAHGRSLVESTRNLYFLKSNASSLDINNSHPQMLELIQDKIPPPVGKYRIQIKQLSQMGKIQSYQDIDPKIILEGGRYTFILGDKTIDLNFSGGNLHKFIEELNQESMDELEAKWENNRLSLLIKKIIPPSSFSLENQAKILGEKTLLTRIHSEITNYPLDNNLNSPLAPTQKSEYLLNSSIESNIPLHLYIEAQTSPLSIDNELSPEIRYQDLRIRNAPNMDLLSIEDKSPSLSGQLMNETMNSPLALAPPTLVEDKWIWSYNFTLTHSLDKIDIQNESYLGLDISKITLKQQTPEKKVTINWIQDAQKSLILMNDRPYESDSNLVSGIIPQLTLKLKETSPQTEITLNISQSNTDLRKDLFSLINQYNQVIDAINILTANYITNEQQEKIFDNTLIENSLFNEERDINLAQELMGSLSGDFSLNLLRTNLINTMTSVYFPDDKSISIHTIFDIGLGTGTIEQEFNLNNGIINIIDEEKLNFILDNTQSELARFLSSFSNQDPNQQGLAYRLNQIIQPYTQNRGVIKTSMETINTRISQENKSIANYQEKLNTERQKETERLKKLQTTINSLDNLKRSLELLSPNRNNN